MIFFLQNSSMLGVFRARRGLQSNNEKVQYSRNSRTISRELPSLVQNTAACASISFDEIVLVTIIRATAPEYSQLTSFFFTLFDTKSIFLMKP